MTFRSSRRPTNSAIKGLTGRLPSLATANAWRYRSLVLLIFVVLPLLLLAISFWSAVVDISSNQRSASDSSADVVEEGGVISRESSRYHTDSSTASSEVVGADGVTFGYNNNRQRATLRGYYSALLCGGGGGSGHTTPDDGPTVAADIVNSNNRSLSSCKKDSSQRRRFIDWVTEDPYVQDKSMARENRDVLLEEEVVPSYVRMKSTPRLSSDDEYYDGSRQLLINQKLRLSQSSWQALLGRGDDESLSPSPDGSSHGPRSNIGGNFHPSSTTSTTYETLLTIPTTQLTPSYCVCGLGGGLDDAQLAELTMTAVGKPQRPNIASIWSGDGDGQLPPSLDSLWLSDGLAETTAAKAINELHQQREAPTTRQGDHALGGAVESSSVFDRSRPSTISSFPRLINWTRAYGDDDSNCGGGDSSCTALGGVSPFFIAVARQVFAEIRAQPLPKMQGGGTHDGNSVGPSTSPLCLPETHAAVYRMPPALQSRSSGLQRQPVARLAPTSTSLHPRPTPPTLLLEAPLGVIATFQHAAMTPEATRAMLRNPRGAFAPPDEDDDDDDDGGTQSTEGDVLLSRRRFTTTRPKTRRALRLAVLMPGSTRPAALKAIRSIRENVLNAHNCLVFVSTYLTTSREGEEESPAAVEVDGGNSNRRPATAVNASSSPPPQETIEGTLSDLSRALGPYLAAVYLLDNAAVSRFALRFRQHAARRGEEMRNHQRNRGDSKQQASVTNATDSKPTGGGAAAAAVTWRGHTMLPLTVGVDLLAMLMRLTLGDEVERYLYDSTVMGGTVGTPTSTSSSAANSNANEEGTSLTHHYFLKRLFRLSSMRFPWWGGVSAAANTSSTATPDSATLVSGLAPSIHVVHNPIVTYPLIHMEQKAAMGKRRGAEAKESPTLRLPRLPQRPNAILIQKGAAASTPPIRTREDLQKFLSSYRPFWGTRLDFVVLMRMDLYIPFPVSLRTIVSTKPIVAVSQPPSSTSDDDRNRRGAGGDVSKCGAASPPPSLDGASTTAHQLINTPIQIGVFRVHCSCHPYFCKSNPKSNSIVRDVFKRNQFGSNSTEAQQLRPYVNNKLGTCALAKPSFSNSGGHIPGTDKSLGKVVHEVRFGPQQVVRGPHHPLYSYHPHPVADLTVVAHDNLFTDASLQMFENIFVADYYRRAMVDEKRLLRTTPSMRADGGRKEAADRSGPRTDTFVDPIAKPANVTLGGSEWIFDETFALTARYWAMGGYNYYRSRGTATREEGSGSGGTTQLGHGRPRPFYLVRNQNDDVFSNTFSRSALDGKRRSPMYLQRCSSTTAPRSSSGMGNVTASHGASSSWRLIPPAEIPIGALVAFVPPSLGVAPSTLMAVAKPTSDTPPQATNQFSLLFPPNGVLLPVTDTALLSRITGGKGAAVDDTAVEEYPHHYPFIPPLHHTYMGAAVVRGPDDPHPNATLVATEERTGPRTGGGNDGGITVTTFGWCFIIRPDPQDNPVLQQMHAARYEWAAKYRDVAAGDTFSFADVPNKKGAGRGSRQKRPSSSSAVGGGPTNSSAVTSENYYSVCNDPLERHLAAASGSESGWWWERALDYLRQSLRGNGAADTGSGRAFPFYYNLHPKNFDKLTDKQAAALMPLLPMLYSQLEVTEAKAKVQQRLNPAYAVARHHHQPKTRIELNNIIFSSTSPELSLLWFSAVDGDSPFFTCQPRVQRFHKMWPQSCN